MLFNKRLFPVWALLAAALMFVYCGDSDEPTEPNDPLAGAALCLSAEICGVCPEGDSATVIEVTNCGSSTVLDWTATENADWFDLSVSSGATPGSFTVTADSNKTTATRTGEIIVTADGLAEAPETLSVTQPLCGSIVHLSVEAWTAAAESDTSDAVEVTNCGNASVLSWSAESESSWLTMLPSLGDTPGEFEIVADSNRSGTLRTGAISVTASGLTDVSATIAVTQPTLEPTLCVSLTEWEAYSLGEESGAISVTNCGDISSFDWEVTETEDWLELSVSFGSTPGNFLITADTNNTGADRAGTVTVTADGVSGSPWQIPVEQPCVITLVGSYDPPGYGARGVFVEGAYAYVVDGSNGLRIIDVSDPASPTLAGDYDTPSYARGVYVSGNYAFVADDVGGLQIVDVSEPTAPTLAGSYDTPSIAFGVYVSGDYAYVADYLSGLQIIDVSDPSSPALAGSYDTDGSAYSVHVSGDYAYVASALDGLQIIDISVAGSPDLIGSYDTPRIALGVFVSGNFAYVADYDAGLQIIDVSDPADPTLAGIHDADDDAVCVYVSGGYAYVANTTYGLQIIDVSDPSSPALAGGYDTDYENQCVYVTGGYAYVIDSTSGLLILKLGL